MSKRRAPFPYPGGKSEYAPWIVEHFPAHEMYVEGFGGAAGVLFQKPVSDIEVYNDLDEHVVNFFRVLRDDADALVEELQAIPFARAEYEAFCERLYGDEPLPDDDVTRAAEWVALRWFQYGGKYEGRSGLAAPYTAYRNYSSIYASGKDDLLEFAERFDPVTIECMDVFELVDYYDTDGALFYFDPPYVGDEGRYLASDDGFDHERFADVLVEMEADWVTSYTRLPDFLDTDAVHVRERDTTHNISQGSGDAVTERIVMNFDPDERATAAAATQQTIADFGACR